MRLKEFGNSSIPQQKTSQELAPVNPYRPSKWDMVVAQTRTSLDELRNSFSAVSRNKARTFGAAITVFTPPAIIEMMPSSVAADTLPMEVRLPTTDGRIAIFYRKTSGDTANPNSTKGYMVDADMETALEQQGGIQTIGYPISKSYKDNLGRETQIFQKEELQLTHDASGKVIKVEDGNTLDGLGNRLKVSGKNVDLNAAPYYLPPSFDWSSDSGKTWDQVIQNHFDKVFGQPAPGSSIDLLQKAYKNNPDWLNLNGLPMSIGTYNNGGLIVVRGQRGAEQYWRDPTPWTNNQPGGIVRNNAGDMLKGLGLIDPTVAQPEDFPVGGGGSPTPEVANYPYANYLVVGDLQRDGIDFRTDPKAHVQLKIDNPKAYQFITSLAKKYDPNGVEVFLHGDLPQGDPTDGPVPQSQLLALYQRLPDHQFATIHLSYGKGAFLQDTGVVVGKRSDGVKEIHMMLSLIPNDIDALNPMYVGGNGWEVDWKIVDFFAWGNQNLYSDINAYININNASNREINPEDLLPAFALVITP